MFELSLLLAPTEGALVRVLGLIERRGFALAGVATRNTAQGQQVTVTMPANGRPADVLLRQVKRLCDVRAASLDVARHAFTLPPVADTLPVSNVPAAHRRGISFLGIPERVSVTQAGYA